MYACESWTRKRAMHWRTDAFELSCWRRPSKVTWTARRSNRSIQKEVNLNICWKDWCWHWSSNTLAMWYKGSSHWKRPCYWERLKANGEGGWHRISLDSITNSMDMNLSKLQEIVKDREAWNTTVNEVAKNWTQLSAWTTTASQLNNLANFARLKRFVSLFAPSEEFFWSFDWEWFLYFFILLIFLLLCEFGRKQTLTVVWRAIYMCEYPWIWRRQWHPPKYSCQENAMDGGAW